MPKQLEDTLLHKLDRHTNVEVPHSMYISYQTTNKFPKQNKDLLGKLIDLKYRDMYIYTNCENIVDHGPESYESMYSYTTKCRIVRCDEEEPYTMVGVSLDYTILLVTDSRFYKEIITQYPIQLDDLIGLDVYDQYPGITAESKGVSLRVDNGEPCFAVIGEFVNDNRIRILLGDECMNKVIGYHNDTKTETFYGVETRNNIVKLRREIFERYDLYYGNN